MKFIRLYIFILLTLVAYSGNSQCLDVSHQIGSLQVGETIVTVTSENYVFSQPTIYCDTQLPYWIGINNSFQSGSGSYTFQFIPPIEIAYLDLYAVNNSTSLQIKEEIEVLVNSLHYSFDANLESQNDCDELIQITSEGNLSCSDTSGEGCGALNIPVVGTIESLTVMNHNIAGASGGSFFQLRICESLNVISPKQSFLKVHPNPVIGSNIYFSHNLENASVTIHNITGQELLRINGFSGNQIQIDKLGLRTGVYFLQTLDSGNEKAAIRIMIP